MPAPLISRNEVVDRLLAVFQRLGYDGASLAELSHATGLGKSSLYHYFPNGKEEMALAVLRNVHCWIEQNARVGVGVAIGELLGSGVAVGELRAFEPNWCSSR